MLRPTHGERRFTAKRTFAGREDERDVFDAAIRQEDTQELYKVLMWYGVGGQGKSTLLREFSRMAKDFNEAEKKARSGKGLALARIDFDDERLKRIDSALYSIRLQLGQASGLSFLTFDAAFVSYYRKTRPGIDVAAEFPELFRGESDALADLLDVLGDNLSVAVDLASIALPGAGLIYKWGSRLTGRLKSWWSTRGNKVLAGIENLTPDELLQKLPSFLGIDICDGIVAKPSLRPVILLDTYEALWRERGQKDALTDRRADAWVRLLVQDSPGALFVVAGRDRLRWDEIDDAWGTVIDAHLLGGLSDEDADRFLKAVPIVEDDIRSRIVESSEGLPFHLDLQVTQYEEMREAGQEPKPEAFGGTPSDILARFLEHLNDGDQAQLRLASYVNVVTRPIMASLAEAFPGRAVNFSFDRMVARSAFTQVSEGAYTIHALMQEELQRREREENEPLFRQIHRHLFQHHKRRLTGLDLDGRVDVAEIDASLNHLRMSQPEKYAHWLLKTRHIMRLASEWQRLESYYNSALELVSLDTDPMLKAALLNNLACCVEAQGRQDESLTHLMAARSSFTASRKPNDPEFAYILFNLARCHTAAGRMEEALEELSTARALLSGHETIHPYIASETLLELGLVTERLRGPQAAERLLKKAASVAAGQSAIQPYTLPVCVDAIGRVLRKQGCHPESVVYSMLAENLLAEQNLPEPDSPDLSAHEILIAGETVYFDAGAGFRTSERLFRKVMLDAIVPALTDSERKHIVDFGHPAFRHTALNRAGKTAIDDVLAGRVMLVNHPERDLIISCLLNALRSIDGDGLYRRIVENADLDYVVLLSEHFDCQYDHESRCFYVLSPEVSQFRFAFGVLYFAEIYRAATRFAGIEPPDKAAGLIDFARYIHGLNLDILSILAQSTDSWAESIRTKFHSILHEDASLFFDMARSGLVREELYGQFVRIFDNRNAA
jgi:tetratricopeptide (TPR) repeat protein